MIGKHQILTFVGMLESYGEIPGDAPHYTALGGKPGYYPPIKGNSLAHSSLACAGSPSRRRRAWGAPARESNPGGRNALSTYGKRGRGELAASQ